MPYKKNNTFLPRPEGRGFRRCFFGDREILLRRMIQGETPRELALVYGVEARSISMILLRSKQTLERHLAASDMFKIERDKHG